MRGASVRGLDDAVLVVCGGAASRIVNGHTPHAIPIVKVHPAGAAERQVDDPDLASPIASGNRDALLARFDGLRAVLIFTVLGGHSGSAAYSEVISCAREKNCKVIVIAGLPLEFEATRERAFEQASKSFGQVDRMFIVDYAALFKIIMKGSDNCRLDAFFRICGHSVSFAIDNLASILEGPFFSTFSEHAYTFSYVNTMNPGDAAGIAVDVAPYDVDPSNGKMVITVGSAFRSVEIDTIVQSVVSAAGIMPDIVFRDDLEDNKFVVFLPVRISPSSPRASRS